ncbi:MAG: hypothetical protein ABI672_02150 [Vicinamibacteria bacterium]
MSNTLAAGPDGRSRHRLTAGLCVVFMAAAFLATQPLSLDLSTRLPNNADALVFSWTLKSMCGGLASPSNPFRGNIFYPDTESLLYTEPLVSLAVQVAPLCAAGLDHVTLFNLTLILSLALSALGAWLLAREITGSAAAALVAAAVFAFTTANFDSAARIQIVASQWTPFCFLYLIRFCRVGGMKNAVLMGTAFAMQALSCTYFEIFLAILLLLSVPLWIRLAGGIAQARRRLPGVAVAGLIAAALVLPVNVAQRLHLNPVLSTRPQAQQITLSFFTDVLPTNLLYGRLLGRTGIAYDALYFPGLLPLGLTAVLLVWTLRRRREGVVAPRGLGALAFVGMAAFLFAFGADVSTPWGDVPGLLSFFKSVPGLGQARVPSRFLMFSRLSLAVMAAAGAQVIIGKTTRAQWLRATTLASLCFLEHWSIPLDTWVVPTKSELPKVYAWLENTKPSPGPILEFPPALQRLRRDEAAWLHTAAFHGVPMANGFSSFRPAWHEFVMEAALRWPDERLMTILNEMGVRTIIVHPRPRGLPEVDEAVTALLAFADRHPDQLRLVQSFSDPGRWEGIWSRLGDEKVFAVENIATTTSAPLPPSIDRRGWSCRSSEPDCERALDGDPATLLQGRDASTGQYLRILFREPTKIQAISIGLGRFGEGFPREPIFRLRQGAEWVEMEAKLDVRTMLTEMKRGSTNPTMLWRIPETVTSGFEIRLRPDDRRFRALSVPEINAY